MNIQQAKQYINNAQAVIFDADGLLIDSEPWWREARHVMLGKRGMVVDRNLSIGTTGMGIREALEINKKVFGYKETVNELIQEWREILYAFLYAHENLLLPGAKELIKSLHKKKKLAIATGGHNPKELQLLLNKFAIGALFDVIASCEEVKRGKPFPDVYVYTAKKLGVDSGDCVVLEDSVHGTKAGKAAGMIVIGVNSEEKAKKELGEAGADVTLDSLKNIC